MPDPQAGFGAGAPAHAGNPHGQPGGLHQRPFDQVRVGHGELSQVHTIGSGGIYLFHQALVQLLRHEGSQRGHQLGHGFQAGVQADVGR